MEWTIRMSPAFDLQSCEPCGIKVHYPNLSSILLEFENLRTSHDILKGEFCHSTIISMFQQQRPSISVRNLRASILHNHITLLSVWLAGMVTFLGVLILSMCLSPTLYFLIMHMRPPVLEWIKYLAG